MELNEKTINKLWIIGIILLLGVIVFFLIKPVLISILSGLLLAYVCFPIYKPIKKYVKNKNLSALLATILIILIIIIPLWFVIPLFFQQSFHLFNYFQSLNITDFIHGFFPTASDQFILQISNAFDSFVAEFTSGALNSMVNLLLDSPVLMLHMFLIGFIFFFTLRDGEKLKDFVLEISPFNKKHEAVLIKQFKGITDSIVYGQIIIGIVQGIAAGIGFLVFGIPNALVLTALAVILSIIPVIGPGLLWVPVAIYLFVTGQTATGVVFFLYNVLIVSTVDNFLRPYIVSKRTDFSSAIVLVGMIGGLFIFGVLGLILGPLLLAYFITFLKAYKDKAHGDLFK